ncbi:MAG: ATP12 family protein [Micropepsaceae bacterium]
MKPGPKRFYTSVDVKGVTPPFAILLDTKPIKTPAGHALAAPTRILAGAVADEWRAQTEYIVPDAMPLTKALNTALDRVAANRDAVVDDLAKYATDDLLCYRAAHPEELVRRQSAAWDPWLDWAAERYGARLTVVVGVVHVDQPIEALTRLRAAIAAHDEFRLTALHTAVTLTGSAVLGLAFAAKALTAEETLAAAHIDETYQAELWGRDAEAEIVRIRRLDELRAARRFIDALG